MTDRSTSERDAVLEWLESSGTSTLVETSQALQKISHRVVGRAALSALQALIEDAPPDSSIERSHLERARLVADAIQSWLADPSDERLSVVRQRTGRAEEMWNALSGDTGEPQPLLATATNAGWCVIHPDQPFNLTPALSEAARRLGDEHVIASVRRALGAAAPGTQ